MNLKTIHILLGLSLCLFVVSFLQTKEGFIEGACGDKCKRIKKKKKKKKAEEAAAQEQEEGGDDGGDGGDDGGDGGDGDGGGDDGGDGGGGGGGFTMTGFTCPTWEIGDNGIVCSDMITDGYNTGGDVKKPEEILKRLDDSGKKITCCDTFRRKKTCTKRSRCKWNSTTKLCSLKDGQEHRENIECLQPAPTTEEEQYEKTAYY